MAVNIGVGKFNPNNSQWIIFHEKLEFYFDANEISDKTKRRDILVNLIEDDVFLLLRGLCVPKTPKDKTYDELCALLKKHYTPAINVFKERKQFFTAVQKSEESGTEFYARLIGLAGNCMFENHLEHNLINQFVMGVNEGIQEKLWDKDEKLTIDEALKIAGKWDLKECFPSAATTINYVNKNEASPKSKYDYMRGRNISRNHMDVDNRMRSPSKHQRRSPTPEGQMRSKCFRCGKHNHKPENCWFVKLNCHSCKRMGHSSRMCGKFKNNFNFVEVDNGNIKENYSNTNVEADYIYIINNEREAPIMLDIKVENKSLTFQLDTGAGVSAISKALYQGLWSNMPLDNDNIILKTYSGDILEVVGSFRLNMEYRGIVKVMKLIVVENGGPPIVGRDFLKKFNIGLSNINQLDNKANLWELLENYKELFTKELGKFTLNKIHLEFENPKPIFFRPRPVPFALRDKVERELDKLVMEGILTKIETSDYGTPLVPILKSDGHIRICCDYKVTINKFVKDFNHPLPRVEEIMTKLQGGKRFTKLDLSCAYNQLELDEETKKFVAWSTHKGVFQVNRLPYGIKPASGIFQLTIEKLLQGIPGVVAFVDDIVVTGSDEVNHLSNLRQVFQRLQKAGLKLNRDKCQFFKQSISYLGYVVNEQGLCKTRERIDAILQAEKPTSRTEARSFCGLVNYYGKFVKNLAEVLYPLYNLTKESENFIWTKDCEDAFQRIKNEIVSDTVLVHFDQKLPIILTCDASQKGIGAVLSHKFKNGDERPIAYISRTLSNAEKNYSMPDKEALAIFFAVKKLYQYLIGNKFILRTDHKPLLTIFGEKKGLPQIAASRLQRWAHYLSGFNYQIEYVRSGENCADMLSRLPMSAKVEDKEDEDVGKASYLNFVDKGQDIKFDYKVIKMETQRDPILSKVVERVKLGTLSNCKNADILPYVKIKDELSVEQDTLLRGCRIVIPNKLRKSILEELHVSHFGIVKTKSMARSYIWWPGIDLEIEAMVKNCRSCISMLPSPQKAPLIPWGTTGRPWSRIHADFAGPLFDHMFLIVVDSYTKWPEIFKIKNATSEKVIVILRELFTRFGLPDTLVTDNGSQFCSHEMIKFLENNRIRLKLTPPGHPATNGFAENMVKTVKHTLKAVLDEHSRKNKTMDIDLALGRFLFDYRTTKHCTTNETPAKLMFNRELKTIFNLLKPPDQKNICDKAHEKQIQNYKGNRKEQFTCGDKVVVKDYSDPNKTQWVDAVIKKVIGPRTYICELPNKRKIKRHINQIRKGGDDIKVDDSNKGSNEVSNRNVKRVSFGNCPTLLKIPEKEKYLNNSNLNNCGFEPGLLQDNINDASQNNNNYNRVNVEPRPKRTCGIPLRYQ